MVEVSGDETAFLSRRWLAATCVFAFALALRLTFIAETFDLPAFRTPAPGLDEHVHFEAAKALNAGADTDAPWFELMLPSAPLLVHWLALWQGVLGDESVLPHRVVNAFLGSGNAVLVYLLLGALLPVRRDSSTPRWIALLAALVWAGLPSLIFFDTALHKPVLALFLLLLLLLLLTRRSRPRPVLALVFEGAASGLLLGLLFLLQLNSFLFVFAVIPFLFFDSATVGWKKASGVLALGLVLAALILPFLLRDRFGDAPYPWYLPQKGIHFRVGHQLGATGGYRSYRDISDQPYGHVFQSRLYAELDRDERQSFAQADQLLTREAILYAQRHPQRALSIWGEKFLRFFNDFEQKGVTSLYQLRVHSRVLRADPLGMGLLVMFAGAGVIALLVQRRYRLLYLLLALLSSVLLSNLLTFTTWRYRLLAVAPLVVLGGLGARFVLDVALAVWRERRVQSRPLVAALVLSLVLCGWLAYRPEYHWIEIKQVGVARRNEALSVRAEEVSAKLAALAGRQAAVHLRRGDLLFNLHRFTRAYALYTQVGACDPRRSAESSCARYVRLLIWLGHYERTAVLLRELRGKAPVVYDAVIGRLTRLEGEVYAEFIRPEVEGIDGRAPPERSPQ